MDDSTANLIVFIGFIVILIGIILKVLLASPQELDRMAKEADKRRSDAIKRGIRNSQINRLNQIRKNKK